VTVGLANNVKKLQGRENEYRLRVGDWRVIFTQDSVILDVLKVSPTRQCLRGPGP